MTTKIDISKLPEHISYSSLSTWQECGWRYYLNKIEGVTDAHAVYFTGGTALHKATEIYDREGGTSDDIWNRAWSEQIAIDEDIYGDMKDWKYAKKEDTTWWYGEGFVMLDNWIKFRNNGWTVYEDFIEKEYQIKIENTTVKLAIDRVMIDSEGKRVLLDVKTGASSQRHPLQLAIYAWALLKAGISIDYAGFWDARSGNISLWNLQNLGADRIEDMLNDFDKARKAGIFLPNLSACGNCSIISSCKYLNSKVQ